MAAETVVTGNIIESGIGIEIVGRVIDTETSEILAAEDVYDEVKDLQGLKRLAEGMGHQDPPQIPLVKRNGHQTEGEFHFHGHRR